MKKAKMFPLPLVAALAIPVCLAVLCKRPDMIGPILLGFALGQLSMLIQSNLTWLSAPDEAVTEIRHRFQWLQGNESLATVVSPNDHDHAGGERDSDSNSHVAAASRASDCSRLEVRMFDIIIQQFNSFFQGSAKAEVLDGKLHITIGTQTMIVTLPEVAGVQSTVS